MEDTTSPTFGMNRRELLKRGAVVGALTWAAPAISSLGSPAFAQTGTPAGNISNVLLTFMCDGVPYHAKYDNVGEADEGFADCPMSGNDPTAPSDDPECELPSGWETSTCHPDPASVISPDGSGPTLCFTLVCTNGSWTDGLAVDGKHGCEPPSSQSTTEICFDDVIVTDF